MMDDYEPFTAMIRSVAAEIDDSLAAGQSGKWVARQARAALLDIAETASKGKLDRDWLAGILGEPARPLPAPETSAPWDTVTARQAVAPATDPDAGPGAGPDDGPVAPARGWEDWLLAGRELAARCWRVLSRPAHWPTLR